MTRMAPELTQDLDWQHEVERRGGQEFAHEWVNYENIADELREKGVDVRPYRIDVEKFHHYIDVCGYRELNYWQVYGQDYGQGDGIVLKKCLEHYVSIELMAPQKEEVVIDIASCRSPFPEIFAKYSEVRAYRQDHMYPPRLEGDCIGGDAAALPVPDAFADMLTLHCSFEHFEGDRDTRFLKEAWRVLKPGGRLCIIPLYTTSRYSIQTDPAWWSSRPLSFDSDALVCIAKGWGERHGRWYDADHFLERIVAHLGDFDLTVYSVENSAEVHPDCHLYLAAMLTKSADAKSESAEVPAAMTESAQENLRLLRETAEFCHLLEETETKLGYLEAEMEQMQKAYKEVEEGSAEATRVYEAEIRRQTEVIEGLVRQVQEQNEQLAETRAELARSYEGHESASKAYEQEIRKLQAVVADLSQQSQ